MLTVKPKGKLSLQRHFKRAEHWVVVRGKPTITIDSTRKQYAVDQAVYIPVTSLHRIENETAEECVLVEVQVGDYLGEDDIERLEDSYGRVTSDQASA